MASKLAAVMTRRLAGDFEGVGQGAEDLAVQGCPSWSSASMCIGFGIGACMLNLAMGTGRIGVMSPEPDHLRRYRNEPRSGNDADDDISCDDGYCHTEDDSDTG